MSQNASGKQSLDYGFIFKNTSDHELEILRGNGGQVILRKK